MRSAVATAGLLAVLAVAGCSDSGGAVAHGPTTTPPSATEEPTLAPEVQGRMELGRRTYRPGELVRIRWPGEQVRGNQYSLDLWDGAEWEVEYYITAVASGDDGNAPSWRIADEGGYGWVDLELSGTGPDVAVVPDLAPPGVHRLCTATSPMLSCALIDVR